MARLTDQQRLIFTDILTTDSNGGYNNLVYYLKKILSNQSINLQDPSKKKGDPDEFFSISPTEAWEEIQGWANKNDINLPMGDRGSRSVRASRLLNYLEINIQGKNREAAAASLAIKESIKNNTLKTVRGSSPQEKSYLSLNQIRNAQYEIIQAQLLGRLETEIQKTAFFKKLLANSPKLPSGAPDPHTATILSGLMAANALNLRNTLTAADFANEVALTNNFRAGDGQINTVSRLIYSTESLKKNGQIDELKAVINRVLTEKGPDQEKEYVQALNKLPSLSQVNSLADVSTLVSIAAPHASADDQKRLARAIQSTIVASLAGQHISSQEIITRALDAAGIPLAQRTQIQQLSPLIEEIRSVELNKILAGGFGESDPRLLHTLNLSRDTGVAVHIPWLNDADLKARGEYLQTTYKTDNLQARLDREIAGGSKATNGSKTDFKLISEIREHLNNQAQFRQYNDEVSGNGLYYLREKIGKLRGNVSTAIKPIDRFYQKINKKIVDVDDFIHAPFAYIADKLESLYENDKLKYLRPLLNPAKFITETSTKAQLWLADRVFSWSSKGAAKAVANKSWYASILTQISEFTGGFIHHEADWRGASFQFIQTKWGNLLDWGARKAGYDGFTAVKAKVGTSLWSGFSKIAPGLAQKLNASSLGKIAASFMLGELSAGTTLLIQAGLMVVWEGLKGVWKFFTDSGWRDKFLDRLPLYAWVGTALGGLMAIPGLVAGAVMAIGSALLAGISAIASSLVSLFISAIIVSGIVVASVFLMYQLLNTSSRLDTGSSFSQVIVDAVCSLVGDEGAPQKNNSTISAGQCIADFLTQFNLNPLGANAVGSTAWNLFLQALGNPGAGAAIAHSATSYSVFQCVGLIVAADIMSGGSGTGFGNANSLGTSPPSGYRYVAGVGSCSPGDFFVDTSGAFGHTGIFVGSAGAVIRCIDANGAGPGVVRGADSCVWPAYKVAGCLKKI